MNRVMRSAAVTALVSGLGLMGAGITVATTASAAPAPVAEETSQTFSGTVQGGQPVEWYFNCGTEVGGLGYVAGNVHFPHVPKETFTEDPGVLHHIRPYNTKHFFPRYITSAYLHVEAPFQGPRKYSITLYCTNVTSHAWRFYPTH